MGSSFIHLIRTVTDVLVAEVGICSLKALLRQQEDPTHGHSLGICWDIMLKVSAPLCLEQFRGQCSGFCQHSG